jgi:putative ABC transport system permease protein
MMSGARAGERAAVVAAVAQDARHGLRLLRREPGFSLLAILTLALGIGSTTTLFSIVDGVLVKPLPWPDAGRLVRLGEKRQGHAPRISGTITNGTYVEWHAQHSTIEEIGGWRVVPTTAVIAGGEPTRLQTAAITPTLFTVLRAVPLRGRLFVDDDGRPGGDFPSKDFVVLSYGLWQEQFGGRDDALGSVIQIGGRPTTVVGIMPKEFAFPTRETRAWTPWAVGSVVAPQGGRRMVIFGAIARLRPGVTPEQAAAEGTARARTAPDPGMTAVSMFGSTGPAEIDAVPAIAAMTAEVRPALLVLLAAVALLLATAAANVASLQLARAATRRREMAVRSAVGAGPGRLLRQLVVENTLVGLAGGAAGLGLAIALHRLLPSVLPAGFPRVDAISIDVRVVAFVVGVSLMVSVACGLLPALQVRRVNLVEALTEDGSAPVGGGVRTRTARMRMLIMAGQLAVSCVLMIGAALLGRSFVALLHADRGYEPRNVLTARLPLPAALTLESRLQTLEAVTERLQAAPGVVSAAFGNALPLVTSGGFRAFKMRSPHDPSVDQEVSTMQRVVSPDYFAAMGLRLIQGRTLTSADVMTAPQVIVVNRSFAAKYLGERPVGAVVPSLGMCRDNDRWEVVGVVEDMVQGNVNDTSSEIFLPHRQIGCAPAIQDAMFVIRTRNDPAPFAATLRAAVRDRAPTLALDSIVTMDERVMTSLAKPRLYAVVLGGFSVFAVVIAAIGLFGVLSFSVAQRVREIGVRTALGARPRDIVMLVARQASIVAAAGTLAGLGLSAAFVRVLSTFLYGVEPYDVATFAGVAVLLLVISAIASILPARRAARTDPLTALRS